MGEKNGVEARLRKKYPGLLDVDGDSCHHIHNISKYFCQSFENWNEKLFNDLFNDFRWSSDLRDWFTEVCNFVNLKATAPERFVSHRWLSVYDISLDTIRLLDAFILFYFGFLSDSDQVLYKKKFVNILQTKSVSAQAQKRIEQLHTLMKAKKKTMTSDGKNRKGRIIEKLFYQGDKTELTLHFYAATLRCLKEYICVFQCSDTLIHQLHEKQAALFTEFFAYFLKAQAISNKTPKELLKINIEEGNMSPKDMFIGAGAAEVVKRLKTSPVVDKFRQQVSRAYKSAAKIMQEKLPINSDVLKSLAAIDPAIKGHSYSSKGLKKLASECLPHILTNQERDSAYKEVLTLQQDNKIPSYDAATGSIAKWWHEVDQTGKYPALSKVALGCLSIFHGPQVEGSFNIMGDILHAKSSRMNIETYSSMQTVKYALRNREGSAMQQFGRTDAQKDPINRTMTHTLRTAASRYKNVKVAHPLISRDTNI